MSEIDQIIVNAAQEIDHSNNNCSAACSKTLSDYDADKAMLDGPHLRMIAWDRS